MKEFFLTMLSKSGKISSKRVCGFIGWIVICACYCYSVFVGRETPSMGELIAAVVALLGVDSITDAIVKTKCTETSSDVSQEE